MKNTKAIQSTTLFPFYSLSSMSTPASSLPYYSFPRFAEAPLQTDSKSIR